MSNELPWKNTLLFRDQLQNSVEYIKKLVEDTDVFSELFEEILRNREQGDYLEYSRFNVVHSIQAFLVVQDLRGVCHICPVDVSTNPIDQQIRPIGYVSQDDDSIVMREEAFGTLIMKKDDYISACSRGHDNATKLLLGDEAAVMNMGYRIVSVFYLFPK